MFVQWCSIALVVGVSPCFFSVYGYLAALGLDAHYFCREQPGMMTHVSLCTSALLPACKSNFEQLPTACRSVFSFVRHSCRSTCRPEHLFCWDNLLIQQLQRLDFHDISKVRVSQSSLLMPAGLARQ